QPGFFPVVECRPATCASPVRAWQTKIALSRAGDHSPDCAYATGTGPSLVPATSVNSCGGSKSVAICVLTMPTERESRGCAATISSAMAVDRSIDMELPDKLQELTDPPLDHIQAPIPESRLRQVVPCRRLYRRFGFHA